MDGSPIEAAYTAARKADKATMAGDFETAAELHATASDKFKEAIQSTTTNSDEAIRTLDVLAKQHLSRSKFLSEKKNLKVKAVAPPSRRDDSSQSVTSDLASSLASARGVSSPNMASSSANNTNTNNSPSATADDPYFRFYNNMNNYFMRAYNQALHEKEKGMNMAQSINTTNNSASIMQDPSESFYVVPNTSNLNTEELIGENASLRAMINKTSLQLHAYEQATQKHKDTFKAQLVNLKNELAGREAQYKRSVDVQVEKLQAENDKLRQQNAKLKSRWDDLKQSARSKRHKDEESVIDDSS